MRRTLLTIAVGGTLTALLCAQTVQTIQNNGPVGNRYDIVILGDGYQAHEEGRFDLDAVAAINRLFSKPSYRAYQSYFNVHTVFRASNESGADHPDATPPIVRDTVYDASYNTGGTPRCLYIGNTGLANADAMLAPDVEGRIIVLVNDSRYGGCAGTFSVSYNGSQGPEVQAHEFGHSFGRLADEYDYGRSGTYSGPEPSQVNITADSTGMIKWPLWLGFNGISAFQGAGYYQTGLWRPKNDCLMRSLRTPLCEVCDEQIVKQAYVTVNPIENRSPVAQALTVQRPASPVFSITNLVPGAGSIVWEVQGQQVASGTTSFTWNSAGVSSGQYTVSVTVTDLTSFVRSDPGSLLVARESWTVILQSTRPGTYTAYGAGCPGSRTTPQTCLSMNTGGTNQGYSTRDGVTYAVRATASSGLTVGGFELHTSSGTSSSVSVPVELYTADASGHPGTRVSTGSMLVGPAQGWYQATFTAPHSIAAGQGFFIAFVSPTPGIGASIVNGTNTPYFRNDGPGGSWNGPLTGYAWAYRIHCPISGAVPALTASGVPEIGTSFDVELQLAPANAPAGLLIGASDTSWQGTSLPFDLGVYGAPGCLVVASPENSPFFQTDASGAATVSLSIPNLPALVDWQFYNQFFVLDAQANTLGLTVSNGGRAKIGQP